MLLTFWLRNVLRATAVCTFCRAYRTEVLPTWGAFNILIWKLASRHSRVHFFDISTGKRWQKWSETEVFWTFWLQNLLRATAACNFWPLICPDGSAPACLIFDLRSQKTLEKQSVSRLFYLFARLDLLSTDSFSSDSVSSLTAPTTVAASELCLVNGKDELFQKVRERPWRPSA